MAQNDDMEMKTCLPKELDVDNYRSLVQSYLNLNLYETALFWADKVVALSSENTGDLYWQAQCLYQVKQYHRAIHLLRSRNLEKANIHCTYLTARCLFEVNELSEALSVLVFAESTNISDISESPDCGDAIFKGAPRAQLQGSLLLLKGKVLEAMDNRDLSVNCFKEALHYDVYCIEAFDALIKNHMLSAAEEYNLLNSLPISQQCVNPEEAAVLTILYTNKLKKYHKIVQLSKDDINATPQHRSLISLKCSSIRETPNIFDVQTPISVANPISDISKQETSHPEILACLQNSLDMAVSEAEQLYYNCDYRECSKLTESILKQDPYQMTCLPIHISCQVELKQSTKLFTLAHKLVELHPNMALSWYAVGCYYYVIGKHDSARRFLSKATTLDRLYGPAWMAFAHSFASEKEHDQAMAAYFKASQLMKGCHLPLLYIGVECSLTNNIKLAEKFLHQAQVIAPDDPYVMHEMGMIAFQSLQYEAAEKHFKEALAQLAPVQHSLPHQWEPLLNNLGHTCRKLKKYEEALEYHQKALVLVPQSSNTYSAIAFIHALTGNTTESADWFHKTLGLRKDDIFSATMLNYVLEQLAIEQPPYPDAPENIPNFIMTVVKEDNTKQECDISASLVSQTSTISDMSIDVEAPDIPDVK